MAHQGTSFNVDNIEKFYLTSCTDLSYELGESTPSQNDLHNTPSNTNQNGSQPSTPSGSKTQLKSKIPRLRLGHRTNQTSQGTPQGSIIEDKEEFTETFSRVFESLPEPVDNSWLYLTNRNDDDSNVTLAMVFNSATVNVIIGGAILIGILSIWQYA